MPYIVKLIFLQIIGPCLLVKIEKKSNNFNEQNNLTKNNAMNTDMDNITASTPVFPQIKYRSNPHEDRQCNDATGSWVDLTKVLDRLFFIVFFTLATVVSLFILCRRPEIPERPWETYKSNEFIFH